MVRDGRARKSRECKDINSVNYYRESKEIEKQGKVMWAIKKSLVRTDLNGFHRVLGMKVRFKRLRSKGVVNK